MELFPVIMAGGSGTRFWPASRAHLPKQFLNIIGAKTMMEQTLERVRPLAPEKKTLVVINQAHRMLVSNLCGEHHYLILEEPLSRSTAPAVGLAAIYLKKQGALDTPMVILPADHFIAEEERFRNLLVIGCGLAQEGHLVTLGITPIRPETGYGYLQRGTRLREVEGVPVYEVKRFVEKPDPTSALEYIRSREYFWNGGIFIFTPRAILEELECHLPVVYEGLLKIESAFGKSTYPEVVSSVYQNFPSISLDYGVMEKTKRSRLVLPGDFGWSDVGSWRSIYDLKKEAADPEGNLTHGEAVLFDTKNSLVFNQSDRLIVGLDLHDILIVSVQDVTLVANLKSDQDIKKVIEALGKQGRHAIL